MAKLGYIGVGMMGHGMAKNLLDAGHEVTVCAHRNREPVDDLVGRGAIEAPTPEALATGQNAVFLCLVTSDQVEQITNRIGPALSAGALVIDTGTSDPRSTLRVAADLEPIGVTLVDAPVGGGPRHAEEGALASLVGGTDEAFARVEPWLEAYSATVRHMGPVGAGHRAKLLNNFVAVGQAAIVIAAYRAARADGIDWSKLHDIMMGGAARSGSLENLIGHAVKGDYTGYKFSTANAAKDFTYLVDYLETLGADTAIAGEILAYFHHAAAEHGGETLLSELLREG